MRNLIVSVLVPLLVLGIGWSVWSQKLRTWTLERRATLLGFAFRSAHDASLDNSLPSFELFQRGSSRYSSNVWEIGRGAECGDFSFLDHGNVGTTSTWTRKRMSYCWFHLPCMLESNLVIRPEGLLDDVIDLFHNDIDFARRQEFSNMFHVDSLNPSFAMSFISPPMMTLLLEHPGASLDFENGQLLIAAKMDVWTAEEMEINAHLGRRIITLTEEYCEDRKPQAGG